MLAAKATFDAKMASLNALFNRAGKSQIQIINDRNGHISHIILIEGLEDPEIMPRAG